MPGLRAVASLQLTWLLVLAAGHQGVPEDDTLTARRAVEQDWAPGHNTAFPDGFPMLIISQVRAQAVTSV